MGHWRGYRVLYWGGFGAINMKTLTEIQAAQIWLSVLSVLYDRKGFDDWWDSFPQEIGEEISKKIELELQKLELFNE